MIRDVSDDWIDCDSFCKRDDCSARLVRSAVECLASCTSVEDWDCCDERMDDIFDSRSSQSLLSSLYLFMVAAVMIAVAALLLREGAFAMVLMLFSVSPF